jgi:hypothetical protein
MNTSPRALILLASRPESVEIAVQRLRPEVMGIIVSQEILLPVTLKCRELEPHGVRFLFRIVDSPMEIGDSFERFEHLLSELEELDYSPEDIYFDATGGTTPMRLGAALAAMTRGMRMVHQRVPQRYVGGRWERDESKEIEVVSMDNPLESTGLLREGQGHALQAAPPSPAQDGARPFLRRGTAHRVCGTSALKIAAFSSGNEGPGGLEDDEAGWRDELVSSTAGCIRTPCRRGPGL